MQPRQRPESIERLGMHHLTPASACEPTTETDRPIASEIQGGTNVATRLVKAEAESFEVDSKQAPVENIPSSGSSDKSNISVACNLRASDLHSAPTIETCIVAAPPLVMVLCD